MKNVYIKFLLACEKVNYWGEKNASIVQNPKKDKSSNSSKSSSPYIGSKMLKSNKLPLSNMPVQPVQPYQMQQMKQYQQLQPIQKPIMNNQSMDPNLLRKSLPQMPMPFQQQQQQPFMMQPMYHQGK